MATTICPYCNIEVSESSIEAEDGCCPECGAMISAASMYMDAEDGDEYDDDGNYVDIDDDDDDFIDDEALDDLFDDELEFDDDFELEEEEEEF